MKCRERKGRTSQVSPVPRSFLILVTFCFCQAAYLTLNVGCSAIFQQL